MAIVSYDRAAAVHATTQRPRIVWERLAALGFTIGAWATIIAGLKAIL